MKTNTYFHTLTLTRTHTNKTKMTNGKPSTITYNWWREKKKSVKSTICMYKHATKTTTTTAEISLREKTPTLHSFIYSSFTLSISPLEILCIKGCINKKKKQKTKIIYTYIYTCECKRTNSASLKVGREINST